MRKWSALSAFITFALVVSLSHEIQAQERTEGPFQADGKCPTFKPRYPSCEVTFGNKGLTVLNSFYETFFGEGAFEIGEFTVTTGGEKQYTIVAKSNRGSLTSQIVADGVVRLGQDLENEKLTLTHQSSYCNKGRIYEHQVGYLSGGNLNVQDLEFWTDNETFYFKLAQNGSKTAEVQCR